MQAPEQKNQNTSARIERHGRGMGAPSEEAVEQRAQELAHIEGRGFGAVTGADRQRAWQELHGTGEPLSTEEAHSDLVASSNPADIAVETGHEKRPARPLDEQQAMEKEIEEGVREAEHERMLQGQNKGGLA